MLFTITLPNYAQIPTGYYDSATGTGYTLKSQLHSIISAGHVDKGYSALYTGYLTTDTDSYYENDGTLLDMYSENPSGLDPYNYSHSVRNCGTYNSENDCYNREHLFPQGTFNQQNPMRTDIHHVVPSDGYVNGRRSNYPFGEVSSPTFTSMNGSKVGANTTTGYSGTVFEPIDEFKGDIARCMLYFATRYETQVDSWTHDMLNGTEDQVYSDWFITLLVDWHTNDPVNQREIDRNNAAYTYQGNRNPFIDHPEYVAQIWGAFVSTPDTENPTAPANLTASNITNTSLNLTWDASTDNVGVASYEIFQDGVSIGTAASTTYFVSGLTQNTTYDFTVFAKDAAGNTSPVSNTENVTTTNIVDITPPTAIVDLSSSNITDSSVTLTWSDSTDDQGVTGYDVYQDGGLIGTTTNLVYNVSGLTASTSYTFTVFAKDGAGNTSGVSNSEIVTTLDTPTFCGNETFTNIGVNDSSYLTRNWTGDGGGNWTATNARTDETLNGKAITMRNGILTLPTNQPNGINSFTITTQRVYTGGSGNYSLNINGTSVGVITYGTTVQTTTIENINISGVISITIDRNSGDTDDRVKFDDLSWTCYSGPSDSEAPTAIVDLASNNLTSSTVSLFWTASTDNIGVVSYEVFQDGVSIGTTSSTSFNVSGLTDETGYGFNVYAKDAAGNTSTISNTESITTTAAPTGATDLFISEYVENSSNKVIEIANYTGVPVDLSVYYLARQANGSGSWRTPLTLSGILSNNDVYVIENASDSYINSVADLSTSVDVMVFNGNDAIGLFKNGTLIELLGVFDDATYYGEDITMIRKADVLSPNTTYTTSEWDTFPNGTYNNVGIHNITLSTKDYIKNAFKVYPNPSINGVVYLSKNKEFEIEKIEVYNFLGVKVLEQSNNYDNKIEVHNLNTGIYILKVSNKDSYSIRRIIIK